MGTSKVVAEDALKQSDELEHMKMVSECYRNALASIFCSVVLLDLNGELIYNNPSTVNLINKLDTTMERLLALAWEQIDLIHGAGFYQVNCDGALVNVSVYPMMVEGDRVGSTLVLHESLNDNCKLPEMYHAMSKLEDINVFLESSHDGIMVVNYKGITIRVNSALEQQLGTTRQNILGRHVKELVEMGLYPESVSLKVLQSHKNETSILPIGGRQLIATGTPVFATPNQLSAVVINLRDITELNNITHEMNRQRLLAEGYIKELQHVSERQNPTEMVAASKEMKNILDTIYAISDVNPTVLVTGESGTGKEVIVNQIHRTSDRRNRPIIKVNCGAIPASLFESEFFGYEDGAFTGARRSGKAGFFELADGGTLLLDEIGEIPLDQQVKLLRALQEGEIIRVGSAETIRVDVRIIAATNQDLWQLVEAGQFRRDLYYRINVIHIRVPPLRERRDDIPPLAFFLLEQSNKKYGKQKELSLDLTKILRTLDWPGNVRELQYLMENMVLLSQNHILLPEDLPERYHSSTEVENGVTVRGILPLKDLIYQAEQQLIENARQTFSTTAEIAAALGVDRTTISRKMGKFCTERAE